MHKLVPYILGTAILASGAGAADHRDMVDQGNKEYVQGNYKKALDYYYQAEADLPESPEIEYNIAGALHNDGGLEKAVELYQKAIATKDILLESAAHYNLGNTYFRIQDYVKAIECYQNALRLNPDDLDAKYNLELARKRLKDQTQPEQQQNQQQNQQQEQQDDQQQNQQDQQQQQQQNEQDQQQDQEQQQQPQDNKQNEQQDQQQQQQVQEKEMSREDAERILNALKDDEREIQKKIRRSDAKASASGRDW